MTLCVVPALSRMEADVWPMRRLLDLIDGASIVMAMQQARCQMPCKRGERE
jgi:hypothetical protein